MKNTYQTEPELDNYIFKEPASSSFVEFIQPKIFIQSKTRLQLHYLCNVKQYSTVACFHPTDNI